MIPRLGDQYDVTIEVISKPRAEYQTDAWFEQDLPVAPAVMVEDEIVTEGADVSLEIIEACIRRHLEAVTK
jgi:disulfide oxidoreductase YuzD